MRSAFEAAPAFNSGRSTASRSSSAEEGEGPRPPRVVGFPEAPGGAGPAPSISREQSCELSERPRRQSSLGQQLLLQSFERQKPFKLPTINTKAPARRTTPRSRLNTTAAGAGQQAAGPGGPQPPPADLQQRYSEPAEMDAPTFAFPGTLPSAGLHPRSFGSDAVAIPSLTRAYTAPEPLPELSPTLAQRLIDSEGGFNSHRSSPRVGPVLAPAPSPTAAAAAAAMGGTSASGQVAALREALRREQEEVSRLRREMSQLKAERWHLRSASGGGGGESAPVTPEAVAEQGALREGTSAAGGSSEAYSGGTPFGEVVDHMRWE